MQRMPGRPRHGRRLAGALGLDGNPLRRSSDQAQAWIRIALFAVFLTRRVGEGMVEGRATMDREHFMTVAPIPAAGHSHRQCHYRCHRLSIYDRAGWNGESTV
jgi:hypothetical protein